MKTFFSLLVFILSINCFSQIGLLQDEVDEFTGTIAQVSETALCYETEDSMVFLGFAVSRIDDMRRIFLMLSSKNLGCLSELEGVALIKLTDDTVIQLTQITDTKCGDMPSAEFLPLEKDDFTNRRYSAILKKNYKKLKNTPIKKIRVYGTEQYADFIPMSSFKEFDPKNVLMYQLKAVE